MRLAGSGSWSTRIAGLKRLVADLTLDNQALKELVGKKA